MRPILALAALVLAGAPALAQGGPPTTANAFNQMTAQDAARLNHAAQSNPQARQALDKVETQLNKGGHPAGQMLEKTRP